MKFQKHTSSPRPKSTKAYRPKKVPLIPELLTLEGIRKRKKADRAAEMKLVAAHSKVTDTRNGHRSKKLLRDIRDALLTSYPLWRKKPAVKYRIKGGRAS